MLFDAAPCTTTVSILEAIAFGAGNACIDIGMASLLSAVAAFVAVVLLIRFIAMRLLRRVFPGLRGAGSSEIAPPEPQDDGLKPMPYEGPIKSTGAWGGMRR